MGKRLPLLNGGATSVSAVFGLFSGRPRWALGLLAGLLLALPGGAAQDLAELWPERIRSVVAIEFLAETELDRGPVTSSGLVADDQGLLILQPGAVNARLTPSQLKEFKVFLPGQSVHRFYKAEYLGQDGLTGWHFVRAEEKVRSELVPVTRFAAAEPRELAMAEEVWGIGLRGKDEDFKPYFLQSRIGMFQTLPQVTGVALGEVTGPGLPVFSKNGDFAGVGVGGSGQTYVQFSPQTRGGLPVVLVNVEESRIFQVAEEVLPYLGRVPTDIMGRPAPWLGTYGLQPMAPEVAAFLQLEDQSGALVSEVLEGSPAEVAGLKNRDILLAIDGQPLPRLKPDRVVRTYVEREIERRRPGDSMRLTVLRGRERLDLTATIEEEPRTQREAERRFFDRLGLTAREFVYADGVMRRAPRAQHTGIIAHFVKPNSPASIAGLSTDDWIREIDGVEVTSFAQAAEQLAAIESDRERAEFVLLTRRGSETAVLRVKLK